MRNLFNCQISFHTSGPRLSDRIICFSNCQNSTNPPPISTSEVDSSPPSSTFSSLPPLLSDFITGSFLWWGESIFLFVYSSFRFLMLLLRKPACLPPSFSTNRRESLLFTGVLVQTSCLTSSSSSSSGGDPCIDVLVAAQLSFFYWAFTRRFFRVAFFLLCFFLELLRIFMCCYYRVYLQRAQQESDWGRSVSKINSITSV